MTSADTAARAAEHEQIRARLRSEYLASPADRPASTARGLHHTPGGCFDGPATLVDVAAERRAGHRGHRPPVLHLDLLPRARRGAVRDRDRPAGFTVDEPLLTLGRHLKLPPWLEPNREQIARALPTLQLPDNDQENTR
jgi:hypothetical protein